MAGVAAPISIFVYTFLADPGAVSGIAGIVLLFVIPKSRHRQLTPHCQAEDRPLRIRRL